MKAVLLRGYGDIDQLEYADAPDPRPAAGEVVVRVISTSVNPVDYKIRSGAMKDRMDLKFPAILGRDVAGEVTSVGEGVTKFKPGDLVMGLVNRSYAEYLAAKAEELAPIPEGLDPKDAGVLPLVLLTGAQLIEKGVQPQPGETILVTGAVGSVGRSAVWVAKQHGAQVVAGVRSRQKDEARSLDAFSIVALDDDDEIRDMPPLDAIADTIDGKTIAKLVPKLKPSGRLASVLGKPDAASGVRDVRPVWAQPDPERLFQLAKDYRDGRLKIPIARRAPLREVQEAQKAAEDGAAGKIALLP